MLQDYYAHGVQRDDDTKTIVGTLQGNPDNPLLIPVSYGAWGFTGGHGVSSNVIILHFLHRQSCPDFING